MALEVMDHPAPQGNTLEHPLAIHLLGAFRVAIGDREVPPARWRLRKASHLVKLLALAPGHTLHREQICDMLWPDVPPEEAYNNLRYALHVARRSLAEVQPQAKLIVMRQQMLTLHPAGPLFIDVEAFEAAAERGLHDPTLCQTALDLYPGDLLPEDRYEEWAAPRRATLRIMHQQLTSACAAWHEAQGAYTTAVSLWQQVVTDEPSQEDAHVALMRLYAQLGQRADAIAQYARLRTVLWQELRVAPAPASQQLYAAILAGRFSTVVARPADPPMIHQAGKLNLPTPMTRFIGREQAMATVEHLLRNHRLVTLMGVGGCGKTRLAVAIAAGQTTFYPDGIWFTACGTLVDPMRVVQTVASSLGIREEPGRLLIHTLIDALHDKTMLVLLDNCEHVIDACRELAAMLLPNCPRLRLLATSREALQVPGEVTWLVPSLTLPPAHPTVVELQHSEAAQLFMDRVRWRQPDFALTPENAQAVADICHRLDGLPLALELAAARTNVVTVAQLVPRLDDALRLLTGGSRTVAPRQQTLRATLDWSYDLLNPQERLLLARLAIFVGGCDLEAAEAVCCGDGIAAEDVLLLLAQLAEKSLILVDANHGTARYRLLEVVRQYARERLEASGQVGQLAERHGDYFLTIAEDAGRALMGAEQGTWLMRLEQEHGNLRAALRHARATENAVQGLRLVRDLWRFWYARGYLHEGSVWLMQFLALGRASAAKDAHTLLWIAAVFGAGRVHYFRGDYATARTLFEEMRAVAEEADDRASLASALTQLGNIALYEGDIPSASVLYAQGLALRRVLGDVRAIGSSLGNLGWVALLQSDYAAAEEMFGECLVLHRQSGDDIEIMRTLTGLGLVATGQREDDRAHALFAECLILGQELQAKRAIADCLDGLAALAIAQGKFARALRLAGAATELEMSIENPLPPIWQERRAQTLASAYLALGEATSAELTRTGRTMPLAQILAEAMDNTSSGVAVP